MKDTWNAFVDSDLYVPPTGTGMLNNLSFALKTYLMYKDIYQVQEIRIGSLRISLQANMQT